MNVKIYQDKRSKNSDGSWSVYLRVSISKKVFMLKTGLTSFFELVDDRFSSKETRHEQKNNALLVKLKDCTDYVTMHPKYPVDRLKKDLQRIVTGDVYIGGCRRFVEFIDEYIKEEIDYAATAKLYGQTKNVIMEFDEDCTFETITPEWLESFYDYRLSLGKKINGIARNMRDIRAVFNYCRKRRYTTEYPFDFYTIKTEKTRHKNLSSQTLRTLLYYKCEAFQERYRDCFMLSVMLWGINCGDLLQLRDTDYYDGYIHYDRNKTGKSIMIKVEPEAEAIIQKYKGEQGYLLNFHETVSDYHTFLQHYNDALKSIGKTYRQGCKTTGEAIVPHLSSNYARHTIASIAAEIGHPMSTISMGLSHTMSGGALVTQVYVEFQQQIVDDCMRDVIDFIYSGKDAKEYNKDKKLKDSGMGDMNDMLKSIYAKICS